MIEIKDLVKQYDDFKLDISLRVLPGTVSGLIGKNGAGKSTTIKSILGLITPDAGTVKVFGKEVSRLDVSDREKIGVGLSDSSFSPYLSASQVGKILKNTYGNFDEELFVKRCRDFDLPLNKRIKEFSTGMKAKLKVLGAMCHHAKLLILDEPTTGLDVSARNEILDMLRSYLSENEDCSLLISSHISSDLEGLCDDVYLIHKGRIILHEDTDKVLSDYGILKVDEAVFEKMDRSHILQYDKESYGYSCLCDDRQYYLSAFPQIIVENCGIDELILRLGGE